MQTHLAPTERRGRLAFLRGWERRLPVSPAFAKFFAAGTAAYFVAQGVLFLFYDVLPVLPAKDTRVDLLLFSHPDVRLLIASALSVEIAIIFKFFVVEHWTFTDRGRHGWLGARMLKFNIGSVASALITLGVVNVLTPVFGLSPYISNTIGAFVGFMSNWAIAAYIIWPHKHAVPVE